MNFSHCNLNLNSSTSICVKEFSSRDFQKRNLEAITNLCWQTYGKRLKDLSDTYFIKGQIEYMFSNDPIIDLVSEIGNVVNVSLSVTKEGSLHYTFLLHPNNTLFIETFLHLDEKNSSYVEYFESNELVFSSNDTVEICLNELHQLLKSKKQKHLSSIDEQCHNG